MKTLEVKGGLIHIRCNLGELSRQQRESVPQPFDSPLKVLKAVFMPKAKTRRPHIGILAPVGVHVKGYDILPLLLCPVTYRLKFFKVILVRDGHQPL